MRDLILQLSKSSIYSTKPIGSNGRFLEISRDLLPIEYIATVLFSLHKAILPDGVSPESFEKASP